MTAERSITVRLHSALRPHADDAATVEVSVAGPDVTAGEVLDALAARYPAVGRRVRDERGQVRRHVNVFVGTADIRGLGGTSAPVGEGEEVFVLASVSGG